MNMATHFHSVSGQKTFAVGERLRLTPQGQVTKPFAGRFSEQLPQTELAYMSPAVQAAFDLVNDGNRALLQGDIAAAEKFYTQSLEKDPTWVANYNRGALYNIAIESGRCNELGITPGKAKDLSAGQFMKAAAIKAYETEEESHFAVQVGGSEQLRRDSYAVGGEWMKKAEQRRREDILDDLLRLKGRHTANDLVYYELGSVYFSLGRYSFAVAEFTTLIEKGVHAIQVLPLQLRNAISRLNSSYLFSGQAAPQEIKRKMDDLELALDLEDAAGLFGKEKYQESLDLYRQIVKRHKTSQEAKDGHAKAALVLADFHVSQGNYAAAHELYGEILKFIPDYAPSLQGIALCREKDPALIPATAEG